MMQLLKSILGGGSAAPERAVSVSEAKARLDGADVPFLLDVRQPDEYRQGHAPGARLIPLDELRGRLHELPQGRDILVICRSGSRSGAATHQLVAAGYQALNVRGGMIAWAQAGLPVKKG
jgi:rhodanese-related sulfurtransferase